MGVDRAVGAQRVPVPYAAFAEQHPGIGWKKGNRPVIRKRFDLGGAGQDVTRTVQSETCYETSEELP